LLRCKNNLRQIGMALHLYASRDGALPHTLQLLFDEPEYAFSTGDFLCTSSAVSPVLPTGRESSPTSLQRAGGASYVYVAGGLKLNEMSPDIVLAYEPPENHGGKMMLVLFGDCRVETLVDGGPVTKSRIDDLIRQAERGIKPVVLSPLPR